MLSLPRSRKSDAKCYKWETEGRGLAWPCLPGGCRPAGVRGNPDSHCTSLETDLKRKIKEWTLSLPLTQREYLDAPPTFKQTKELRVVKCWWISIKNTQELLVLSFFFPSLNYIKVKILSKKSLQLCQQKHY